MTTLNMTTKLMSSIVFTAAVVLTLYVRQSLSLPVVDAIQPYDYLKIYNDQKRNQRRRAFPKRRHDHHRHHNKKTGTRRVETPVTANDDDDVQELYITQKLDHFDPLSTATYQQRYFVSYRYNSADDGRLRLDAGNGKNVTSRSTSLKGATVINFLCVGGEGPGFDKSVLVDSVHCSGDMLELASKIQTLTKITDDSTTGSSRVSINLYALEHRYYGKSYPSFDDTDGSNQTSPVTTNHLKYLSSRQALEDLAHFIRTINSETRMSGRTGSENDDGDEGDVLWVTFGGSYPGYMSLNARYKYPHLVHASVSSSAPLQLEVDFPGYKARQGWDLKYKKVGGSEECYRIVKTGHDQAVTLLTMPGRNTTTNQTGAEMLARKFDICNPESALSEARNAQLLLGDGLINIPAQSNDPSCGDDALCNIAGLCEYMEKEFEKSSKESSRDRQQRYVHDNIEDPAKMSELDVLAKVAKHQRSSERRRFFMYSQETDENVIDDDDDCMEVDFQAMIAEWNKTSVEPFGWRSWLWQTCTEVGFYQTCLESTDCPFATNYHTVDMDLEICNSVFGFTPSQVYENIQATLDHYGGLNINDASRVLSVNGNVDPWSVLALQTSPKYSLPVAWADGQSHHFWTHRVKDTDEPEIVEVRNYIYSVVLDWLGLSMSEDTSVSMNNKHPKNDVKEVHQKVSTLRRRK